ncbi:MAG: hypothetical protein PF588_08465 [Candidatus Kapabacteria bacterium]|jgi:hypothetical protein|nr:hypothetical protein [Candidatus Kapabacteria bacterium]
MEEEKANPTKKMKYGYDMPGDLVHHGITQFGNSSKFKIYFDLLDRKQEDRHRNNRPSRNELMVLKEFPVFIGEILFFILHVGHNDLRAKYIFSPIIRIADFDLLKKTCTLMNAALLYYNRCKNPKSKELGVDIKLLDDIIKKDDSRNAAIKEDSLLKNTKEEIQLIAGNREYERYKHDNNAIIELLKLSDFKEFFRTGYSRFNWNLYMIEAVVKYWVVDKHIEYLQMIISDASVELDDGRSKTIRDKTTILISEMKELLNNSLFERRRYNKDKLYPAYHLLRQEHFINMSFVEFKKVINNLEGSIVFYQRTLQYEAAIIISTICRRYYSLERPRGMYDITFSIGNKIKNKNIEMRKAMKSSSNFSSKNIKTHNLNPEFEIILKKMKSLL